MNDIQYRTETFSGSNKRLAEEVVAFEIFKLGNTDILQTLAEGLLKGRGEITKRCWDFIDELNNNGFIDDMGEYDQLAFCRSLIEEVGKVTGINMKYALWLADKEEVNDPKRYGSYVESVEDFDCYEVGPVVLSDLGSSGKLYGYPEEPIRLEDLYEDLKDELTNIINEREDENIDYRRALWLDERYAEVDNKISDISKILESKSEPTNAKPPLSKQIDSAANRAARFPSEDKLPSKANLPPSLTIRPTR